MTPVRPLFSNGAVLGAADLTTAVDADRDRDARHARHLHTPGIANGLALATSDQTTAGGAPYVDVVLETGVANDPAGRELVVAEPIPLAWERFLEDVPSPRLEPGETFTVWHPVFLRGRDDPVAQDQGPAGCGAATGPARMEEQVEIEFGVPGDETAFDPDPPPDAGPVLGSWRVLVGFVRFDTVIKQFVKAGPEAGGVRAPGAGVRADLVAGRGGQVEIRPQARPADGVAALVVGGDPASLLFGRHKASGGIEPLLTVDSAGNVEVKGKVNAVKTSGGVLVNAGTAFHGTVLPLPAGAGQVLGSGAAEVAVHLTPRLPDLDSAPSPGHRFVFAECHADADRRVTCWGSWFDPANAAGPQDAAAACDYLVLVSVPASEGP